MTNKPASVVSYIGVLLLVNDSASVITTKLKFREILISFFSMHIFHFFRLLNLLQMIENKKHAID